MRINTNINALNAHRQLMVNTEMGGKAMEKLSSGLRINRAGDDAAGLAISEKMRGQIRGLRQASRNAQDGISLIQTAEGALSETHAILQKMRELAVQSSSDTNTDDDRKEIQEEINQLAQEITRIAEQTQFNTKPLLNGELEVILHIGANEGQNVRLSIGDMGAAELGVKGTVYKAGEVLEGLNVRSLTGEELTIKLVASDENANEAVPETTAEYEDGTITITLAQAAGDGEGAGAITATHADVKAALKSVAAGAGILVETVEGFDGSALAAAEDDIEYEPEVDSAASKGAGIYVITQETADAAINTINEAITMVSAERSMLGAMQNRLEHTIANLGTSAENLQAAESRIRDVDMAAEIMEFTKANILNQAATAMLAQANIAPQTVLQLLG